MSGEDETRRIVDPALSFVDARLAKLVAYWREHAQNGGIPDRAAFGPDALHRLGLIANVVLFDVIDGGARFRVRLVASGLTAMSGRDNTGRFLDELYPAETYEPIAESMRWTLRERRPLRTRGTFALVGKEFIAYEAFTAPLTNGGAEATMIVTAVVRRSRRAT